MRAALLLLFGAATLLIVTAQEPQDCPPCYTLVQQAVETHRQQLSKLDELLRNVGRDSPASDDREFQRKLAIISANIEDLYNDARRAVLRDSSPLLVLGDLQERIEEVKKVAGSLLVYLEQARVVTGQGDRTITEAEEILRRIEMALRETLAFLEGDGADALLLAIEQSKQFGLQSAQMSEIARKARQLADRQEQEAKLLTSVAATAVSNSTAAYKLAYTLLEQQRNYSSEISLLGTSLSSTELLVSQTRSQAEQAQREAAEAYDMAFNLYSEARAGFGSIDVAGLKRRAGYIKAEAQRLKDDLEELTNRHSPMLDSLDRDISSLTILIERGLSQQMSADGLMADVTAARDKAREAVATGERTLEEAQKTLETLLQFDRQVQESREQAQAALRQVEEILRMVELAEQQTVNAGLALQGAERNAAEARDVAGEAEDLAEEAYGEVIGIQTQTAATSTRATALREQSRQINGQVSETTVIIDRYERQLEVDSALAREALEKAGEAAGNARDAQAQVEAALKKVQEIMAALAAAGALDTSALDELERRLEAAEAELARAELQTKLDEFRAYRVHQDRMVKDYEGELAYLRVEVANVEEISDALPTGCYNRITLEP